VEAATLASEAGVGLAKVEDSGRPTKFYAKVAAGGVRAVIGLLGEIAAASDSQLRDVEQVSAFIKLISYGIQHSVSGSGSEKSASAS
jgi:hypothetical protein